MTASTSTRRTTAKPKAAPQQKKLQSLFRIALCRNTGSEGPVTPARFARAGAIGYGNSRITIAAEVAHKRRRAQMHALKSFGPVLVIEQLKLQQQRLEFRASRSPDDPPHAPRKLQPPRMFL